MFDAGMGAFLPDLLAKSDTGWSNVDNLTSDQTPTLTGRMSNAASQARLIIDGRRVAEVPVVNGLWRYAVPADAALAAGGHTIAARAVDASGKVGRLSEPLAVKIVTPAPNAPTLRPGNAADTGTKGDEKTIDSVRQLMPYSWHAARFDNSPVNTRRRTSVHISIAAYTPRASLSVGGESRLRRDSPDRYRCTVVRCTFRPPGLPRPALHFSTGVHTRLLETVPEAERVGPVFKLERFDGQPGRPAVDRVSQMVGKIGAKAKVRVDVKKTASAHDLRRAFGERWAARLMPAQLMELMRHESIDTTLSYYVGRNAERTAAILWDEDQKAVRTHAAPADAAAN